MQAVILFLQHHWLLSFILIVGLFLLVVLEWINQKRQLTQLTALKATQLINHDNAVVVDIRNATTFAEGHIIEAISLPASEMAQKTKKLEKYRSRPIIIACASGIESPKAAGLLAQQGFNVQILAGGMRAWQEAGMPLVKG